MSLYNFYYEYFGKTIILDYGYNIVNTLVYSIIALLIFFYIVRPFIKNNVYFIDSKFFLSISLITIFGAMLRVFEEPYSVFNIVKRSINPLEVGYYFITPGIYLLVLFIAIYLIYLSKVISSKYRIRQNDILLTLSLILFIPTLLFVIVGMTNRLDFVIYLIAIVIITGLIVLILRIFGYNVEDLEIFALSAQITDGVATYCALAFYSSFREQHLISGFIINNLGLIAFPIIKMLFCLIIIYIVRKSDLDVDTKRAILLFVTIFGFATGFRDLFSIASHVI